MVVDDCLGIGADLEAAMALQVSGYQDEWAATLQDPLRLRRFRSFVNAPAAADPSVVQVLERDQIRPATSAERESVLLAGPVIPVRRG